MNDAFKNFELVSGDKIGYWYNHRRYEMIKGTLSNSCMSSVPTNFFDIYMDNPSVCNLLILKNDDGDKIRGRALVWHLTSPEGVTFMDRVYSHEDSDVELFREYAKSKGWYYKPRNDSSDSSDMVSPSGGKINMGDLVVMVKKGEYDRYPYIDTIKNYTPRTGKLTTGSGEMSLEDTDGGGGGCEYCNGDGEVECYECEGGRTESCNDCDGDGMVDCNTCDGDRKIECDTCDGEGEVDCDTCDGEGKDEDGEDCSDCEGKGKVSCTDCNGQGKSECSDCEGRGTEECEECNGRGEHDCNNCGGSGMTECGECN
jgi:hypothetical protein